MEKRFETTLVPGTFECLKILEDLEARQRNAERELCEARELRAKSVALSPELVVLWEKSISDLEEIISDLNLFRGGIQELMELGSQEN